VTDLDSVLAEVEEEARREAEEAARRSWLANRRNGFGCSDLPALFLILGWVSPMDCDWREETVDGKLKQVSDLYVTHSLGGFTEREYRTPRYLWELARPRPHGLPGLILEKAGLPHARGGSDAQEEGKAKEAHLFRCCRLGSLGGRATYYPEARALPTEWASRIVSTDPWVICDKEEPRLLCTLEADERGATPDLDTAWELKTDRPGKRLLPPWAQALQARGQGVVMGHKRWGIQYGPGWAMTDEPAFPDLPDPVEWGPYQLTPGDGMLIRKAVGLGWKLVEEARAGWERWALDNPEKTPRQYLNWRQKQET